MTTTYLQGEKSRTVLALITARSWKDQAYRDRFISEPELVLHEEGIQVPEGISLKVVVDEREIQTATHKDTIHYITLPSAPSHLNVGEASLIDLMNASHEMGVEATSTNTTQTVEAETTEAAVTETTEAQDAETTTTVVAEAELVAT